MWYYEFHFNFFFTTLIKQDEECGKKLNKYLHRKCYQKCYLITFSILFFEGLGFYARPDYTINISERMKNIEYKVKNIEFLGVEAEYEVDHVEDPKKLLVVSSTSKNSHNNRW